MTGTSPWAARAVAAVEATSSGAPVPDELRVTLNFHPDRLAGDRRTLEALADDGVYRSQFETGTSNGGLTAFVGGDRWRWEQRLFDGAYDDAPVAERPKYGALDHRRRPLGGAPRFGSAHLRLAGHVIGRATFCFPDSSTSPSDLGTAHRCGLLTLADAWWAIERDPAAEPEGGDLLDGYIEAQVHGVVDLATDVEALVLDPCYRGTWVEATAARTGVAVEWHEGRVLTLEALEAHPTYRDPGAYAVGREVAEGSRIDARIIGDAARSGRYDPQDVKQLWHLTARYGRPAG